MPKRLLQVPHYKQHHESDCLAACAAMILDHLGFDVPYQELLDVLDITPWGTPHRNIANLEQIIPGSHVIYKQGALIDLFEALDNNHPVVAFVWTGDLPYWTIQTWHAVVIIGYDEYNFYLNDPAFDESPQVITHGDFDLAWIEYDTYYAVIVQEND